MKKSLIALFISIVVCVTSILVCQIQFASSNKIINKNLPVIIIDAGHGGEDGGAIGIDGTYEKEINLQIALKTNEILSVFGYETHLIRDTDRAIHTTGNSIRERKVSDIHNRIATMDLYEKCIYLSIHQNKYSDSTVWGAQTFYSANINESQEIARFIQNAISSQLQPQNKRQIKMSNNDIYILKNATKPTVMVECGFMSNQNELNELKNNDYQNSMALSIIVGITNYNISEDKNGSKV